MRCLLDTHTYLWAVDDNTRLSHRAFDIIEDDSNELVLSIASLWEIAIKLGTGKLQIRGPFRELALVTPATRGVSLLSITPEHLDQVLSLPEAKLVQFTGHTHSPHGASLQACVLVVVRQRRQSTLLISC